MRLTAVICVLFALIPVLLAGCIDWPAAAAAPVASTPTASTAIPSATLTPTPTSTSSRTSAPTATPTPSPLPTATPTALFSEGSRRETKGSVSVVTTTRQTNYFIHGTTAEQLDREMRTVGPTDAAAGLHWYALTEPRFGWDKACTCTEAGCAASAITVYLSLDYWLPLWLPPEGVEEELVWDWQAFSLALLEHERGHGALAMTCAWALGDTFSALPPAPTCADLDAAMQAASSPVFATCRAEQRHYENTTNHGQKEGVVWPP